MAPTMAARAFATLDQLSGGRASVHIISGASDAEMLRDGDRLTKEQRYRRSREYLTIMRKMWTSDAPFDHEGEFYRLSQAFSMVKPTRPSRLTVSWAGSSLAALETAGECADIYAMIGDGPDVARENARLVSAEAERHGRKIEFAITFCVIIGDTEAQAWARAHEILDRISARFAAVKAAPPPKSASAEIERVLRRSLETDRIGKNIWLTINNATRMATGNNTTIVGTVEQVAETLMLYHDIGFRSFLVRGFDPLEDAKAFGKALIPAIRAESARRDARAVA
jgi:alkanesulfonate monooxygenase